MVLLSWMFVRMVEHESRAMQSHKFSTVRYADNSRMGTNSSPDPVTKSRKGEC